MSLGARTRSRGSRAAAITRRAPLLLAVLGGLLVGGGGLSLAAPPARGSAVVGGWTPQASGTSNALAQIACPTVTTCYAVGEQSTILATTNGGATWTAQTSGVSAELQAIACPAPTTCYVVSRDGLILTTTNGGATWTQQSPAQTVTGLPSIACPTLTTCLVAGDNGTILLTTDGGATWTAQTSNTTDDLSALTCPGVTTCYVVGRNGTVRMTADGGSTWLAQNSGTTVVLSALACPTATTCVIVGHAGTLLATTDGGYTWTARPPARDANGGAITADLYTVACPDALTCYALGFAGTIIASSDGGMTWTAQPSPTNLVLAAVACPGVALCLAVGDGGIILAATAQVATPAPALSPTVTPLPPTATTTATPLPPTATTTATPVAATPVASAPTALSLSASLIVAVAGQQTTLAQSLDVLVPTGAAPAAIALHVAVPSLASVPDQVGPLTQANNVGVGFAYDLTATSAGGQAIRQFNPSHPLLIQLTYDPALLSPADLATLHIAFLETATQTWRALPTTVDPFRHLLTASTTHFTLFQVRSTARTQARLSVARARLSVLAAAGPPRVTMVPLPLTMVQNMPLIIRVPRGAQRAPVNVQITGAPGLRLSLSFTLSGVTVLHLLALDTHGYVTTAFLPATALKTALPLRIAVAVRGATHPLATQTVTLLPGRPAGPLPPGAPPLLATLSASRVPSGAPGPVLLVTTVPGAAVRATLQRGVVALSRVLAVTGHAGKDGRVRLHLPVVPRSVLAGAGRATLLQVVVTSTLRGYTTQQTLPLTVLP